MARRRAFPLLPSVFGAAFNRSASSFGMATLRAGTRILKAAAKKKAVERKAAAGTGSWIAGVAFGPAGPRAYRLFRPPQIGFAERLPLLVMLHGCGQTATGFAASTRMNRIAGRQRFLALYPEQDRGANAGGCWNWFETRSGRAHAEAETILAAIDQVLLLYPADRGRVALAGMSAGASMSALLASRAPERFRAVVMHSGIPPGVANSTLSAMSAMRGGRRIAADVGAGGALPPLLVIHGTDDRVVAAENGRAAALAWAEAGAGQAGVSRLVQRGLRRAMTVTEYKARRQTVATLCEVDGLGHAWSGGDEKQPFGDAGGPDASRLAWAFIARQFARLDT